MISDPHADYLEHQDTWAMNRDAFKGESYIKAGGTKYLPKLSAHYLPDGGQAAYDMYKQYAKFLDATYRTVTAMSGLIFRKPPYIQGEQIEKYEEDFTIDNKSLISSAETLVSEVLLQGRVGLFISYPDVDTSGMSRAEFEEKNIHAYGAIYKTEDILNWKLEKRNGRMVPVLVVIQEQIADPYPTDKYDTSTVTQYHVLELDENDEYKQTVYVDSIELAPNTTEKSEGMTLVSETYPTMNGERLNYIPFFPITPRGICWDIIRSPLSGIVELNIAHYRNSANYEAALVKTASPTPTFVGYRGSGSDDEAAIILGGNQAILLNEGGRAEYLEYQGNGINAIKEAMEEKKKEMAVLGVRILSVEEASNISADVASIHQSGEQAVLATVANAVSDALTQGLRIMASWDDYEGELTDEEIEQIVVQLNSDFTPTSLTANQINSLIVAWKSLAISDEELFSILKQGEIIRSDVTYEDHVEQIKDSMMYDLMNTNTFSNPDRTNVLKSQASSDRFTNPEEPDNPNAEKSLVVDEGGKPE